VVTCHVTQAQVTGMIVTSGPVTNLFLVIVGHPSHRGNGWSSVSARHCRGIGKVGTNRFPFPIWSVRKQAEGAI